MSIKQIRVKPENDRYSIILLYAGNGKKLKSGPRPLLEFNGKYLFEHQIKNIERRFAALDHSIIAVTGYEANSVMNKLPDSVIKIENENYETSGIARSIGMGLRASNANHIVVIYGDLFFTHQAIDFPFGKSSVVVDKAGYMNTTVGCSTTDECIDIMLYGMPFKWCEITYYTGKELDYLKRICWDENKYRLLGFEVINEIINKGGKFTTFSSEKAKVCDLDCARRLLKSKELVL
jgi:hypothetical protein